MFLTTPRLLLRPPWPEDAPAIAAVMEWDIARMTGSMPWPYGVEDALAFVARPRWPDGPLTGSSLTIVERGAPERPIGGVGFAANFLSGELEIGYWLARAAWGRGYATEAAAAWLELAFGVLPIEHLIAGHFEDNPDSGRVLVKLGFRPTGRVFDYPSKARGGTAPSPEYRLTRADWRSARPAWAARLP